MLSSLRKSLFRDWLASGEEILRGRPDVAAIAPGDVITFAALEQPELSGKACIVASPTIYHFNGAQFTSYPLYGLDHQLLCQMIVASGQETGGTPYLALSRKVPDVHKAHLCLEEDYARLRAGEFPQHLYVREHTAGMAAWLYMHYEARLKEVRGSAITPDNDVKSFHYSLYVSLKEYKALEIERYPSGEVAFYATVFHPAESVALIERGAARHKRPLPDEKTGAKSQPSAAAKQATPVTTTAAAPSAMESQEKRDSAQIFELPVPTPAPPVVSATGKAQAIRAGAGLTPHGSIQCNLRMASKLVEEALRSDMRVGDVIRKALGLSVAESDLVAFDLRLSERDYQLLAERFEVGVHERDRIHGLIMEELGHFTGEPVE